MRSLNVHFLQHADFEGLGSMEDWFLDRGHRLSRTRLYRDQDLPEIASIDFLVVMGGPMGVYETAQYPWIEREIDWIRSFVASGKPVLGICLGAQLLAASFGQKVYPSGRQEIGWFDIELAPAAKSLPWLSQFETVETVFHWHGDTFDLPEGAVRLASSKVTVEQGFQWGDRVVALQFHPEIELRSLNVFLETESHRLTGVGSVQTPEQARNGCVHSARASKIAFALLAYLEGKAAL